MPSTRLNSAADRARFIQDANRLCSWFKAPLPSDQSAAAERIAKRASTELGAEMREFLGWLPGQTIDPLVKWELLVREVEAHGAAGWTCPAILENGL